MVFNTNIARILICVYLVVSGHCDDDPTPASNETFETDISETLIDISSTLSTTVQDNGTTQSIIDTDDDKILTIVDSSTTEDFNTTTVYEDDSAEITTNTTVEEDGNVTPETNMTVCSSDPCRNGGTCVDEDASPSSFTCHCPPGYEGVRCGVENRCVVGADGVLCEGGACIYSEDGLFRQCGCFNDMHWDPEQKKCRDPDLPCFPNPCLNGGTCSPEDESVQCRCTSGFEGWNCSVLNKCGECERGRCLLDEKTSIKYCRCDDGLYWNEKREACEETTSPCLPEPCENGGSCIPEFGEDYNCSCAMGFSGKNCEVVDKCSKDEDCGEHGKCTLSEDETKRTCKCENGFYLEEQYHTCNEIVKPCLPNPCSHDGICTPFSENEFNCTCSAGYTGTTCGVRDMCEMDGGKAFCTGASCTDKHEIGTYICICQEGQYFGYSQRKCQELDPCPLMQCGDTEKCIDGKCECQEHWSNSTGTCKPNFCSSSPCPSSNMTCYEGSGNSDYTCHCEDGYAFNGTHCNEAVCAFPSLNECTQKCEVTDESYECECEEDFQLKEDDKECVYTGNSTCSNKTCDKGTCVRGAGEEICICSNNYVEEEGRCVDVCSAGVITTGVCPLDKCEGTPEGGFRCTCDGKYALSMDKTTCTVRAVCQENESGWKTCTERNAKCVPDWNKDEGFQCVCVDGLIETTGGICRDICSIESNQRVCSAKGAKCDVGIDGNMICKCPPYFQESKDGSCSKPADRSFLVTFPLAPSAYQKQGNRKQRSLDPSLDYRKILRDVTLVAQDLFLGFTDANILACSSETGYISCKIELQFLKVHEADLRRLTSDELCLAHDGSTTCLLPPSLVLVKGRISKNVDIQRTDPCDEDIREENCGSETTCSSSQTSKNFNCSCKPGFVQRRKIYPFGNTKSVVEICRDIDECVEEKPCPANSLCTNSIGSYFCSCNPGFRSLRVREEDICVETCSPNPCTHGDCSTRGDHDFDCTCKAGYRGTFCNLEDKNFKGARINTVIVGVVLGGVLLLTIVLFAACVSRLKRKRYFEDPGHMLYNSAEMTERRRVVGGAINNAFQRE